MAAYSFFYLRLARALAGGRGDGGSVIFYTRTTGGGGGPGGPGGGGGPGGARAMTGRCGRCVSTYLRFAVT